MPNKIFAYRNIKGAINESKRKYHYNYKSGNGNHFGTILPPKLSKISSNLPLPVIMMVYISIALFRNL